MRVAPSMTPRDAKNKPHNANSLTAFAFAPGVLNTGTPNSDMSGTLQLFVPAPHLAIDRHINGTSDAWSLWLLSKMAWAPSLLSSLIWNMDGSKRDNPAALILLKVLTTNLGAAFAAAAMVVSCCFSAVLVLGLLCSQLGLRSLGALG